MKPRKAVTLTDLPPELLCLIYSFIPVAKTIASLSSTCSTLLRFSEKEGWRVFVNTQFPSAVIPSGLTSHKDAAHGLTTLSRNWKRKAFIARYIEPAVGTANIVDGAPIESWPRASGQTMGYQPSIDSYEEITSNEWASRRQVVAWSAGADLVLRVSYTGVDARRKAEENNEIGRKEDFDDLGRWNRWAVWRRKDSKDGIDDITSVTLFRPFQRRGGDEDRETLLMGTASGRLSLLHASVETSAESAYSTFDYETSGRQVRAADVSPSRTPLLAACLSDSTINVYRAYTENAVSADPAPLDELCLDLSSQRKSCRVWSTRFLSKNRLALGLGPSTEPIHVYDIVHGLSSQPIRKFMTSRGVGKLDGQYRGTSPHTSVYPITPAPPNSQVGHPNGDVFLSGSYDGLVQLHDMRAPSDHVTTYVDATDDSAIYSLQTIGHEKLVAGASRHSIIKIFDFRFPSKQWSGQAKIETRKHNRYTRDGRQTRSISPSSVSLSGWNLFLNPRNHMHAGNGRHRRARDRRATESPIYALSSPSSSSPTLFAGVENKIVQLEFTSVSDPQPDPLFSSAIHRSSRGELAINARKTWNSDGQVLNLAAYDRRDGDSIRLFVQKDVGMYRRTLAGHDERWKDVQDD